MVTSLIVIDSDFFKDCPTANMDTVTGLLALVYCGLPARHLPRRHVWFSGRPSTLNTEYNFPVGTANTLTSPYTFGRPVHTIGNPNPKAQLWQTYSFDISLKKCGNDSHGTEILKFECICSVRIVSTTRCSIWRMTGMHSWCTVRRHFRISITVGPHINCPYALDLEYTTTLCPFACA